MFDETEQTDAGYPIQRAALFERLIEATAPPPANPCACQCDRCVYGRYRRGQAA